VFRLNNWPTQIFDLTLTAGDSEPVQMVEVSPPSDPTTFYFTAASDTFDNHTYLKLTQGMWYYDYTNNTIVIPTQYKDPTTSNMVSLWSMNQTLYSDPANNFTLKTLPNMLLVEYFVGNGTSIDVQVKAIGQGPSYQLEPDSVCFIVGEGLGAGQAPPVGHTSDPMPSMGMSVPLKTNSGERVALHWQVYNHGPLVWDNLNNQYVSWIVGDELGAQQWGQGDIFNVMTGGLGDSLDQIGIVSGGAIGGFVTGTCTIYGAPNTILSGTLVVYAKAITIRTYQTPAGTVTMSERTGGFRCGGFTFKLEITDTVQNRRTGVMCEVPTVLIYARERSLDSDAVPLA
jgi:hypothetical protein